MTSHMDLQSSRIDRNESLLMGWITTLASQAISRPMHSSFQLESEIKVLTQEG